MDLNQILAFTTVARTGSFSAAARELGIPKSTLSRKVAELERRLGARLLQRTTRKLSLTDSGHAYFQHATRAVQEAEEAELAVQHLQDAPRGLLRITTPLTFAYLRPIIASFLQRFTELRLEMMCTDRVVDLIEERFDLAIRVGRLSDSGLIARPLGSQKNLVVASPSFLERHGSPKTPSDLKDFDCLAFGPLLDARAGAPSPHWTLLHDGASVAARVQPRLFVNDFDLLLEAAVAGLGIALLPAERCHQDLKSGKLQRVLPEWCSPEVPVHAVYPSTRHLSPKVKLFVEHVQERIGRELNGS
jgi:DNA-binding transcriptional LysR family regulator